MSSEFKEGRVLIAMKQSQYERNRKKNTSGGENEESRPIHVFDIGSSVKWL